MPPPGKGKAEKLGPKKTSKKNTSNNVSPGQSMAMAGNTSLAGLSQKAASDALKAGQQNKQGTKYSGKLADFMAKKNVEIAQNQAQIQRDLLADPSKAGFKGFLPKGFGKGLQNFGQGIMSSLTPQRMIGSALGTALLGPLGGIIGGLIGGTYGDDDPSNNFFGKIGSSLKKDFTDTVNFFTPQQVEQPMMTNMPMKRPMQMFPIQSVTDTTGMPFMDQIPDMFPDNEGVPTYTPEAAGFGIDSLMQSQQNETFTMPERNKFMDYGTMPRVTSAPLGTSSTPTNAVDMFGNPVVSGVSIFDPSVEVIDLGTADREITPGTFSENLSFQDIVDFLSPVGMNQIDAINRLDTNVNQRQVGDFRMPIINPEKGITNMYPSGQAIEMLPGGGVIFNDPSLMAPNEAVVDPFSGQLVPSVNLKAPRMFDI